MTDKIFETPDVDTSTIKNMKYSDNKTITGGIIIHIEVPKTRIIVEMWENIDKADQASIIAGVALRYPTTQPVPNSADK